MIYAVDVIIIITLFLLFSVSHTILASTRIKIKLVETIGNKIAFYRLFYNLSSLLIFGVIWAVAPKPSLIIYDLQYPYDIAIFVLQLLSIAGFLWAGSYVKLMEFLGIEQVIRFVQGNYDINDIDEKTELKLEGPLKFCRHPIYLFSILILALRPTMDLFYLVFLISITTYFIIGSYYEEKKLVEKYGDVYKEYQKRVARIIPKIY